MQMANQINECRDLAKLNQKVRHHNESKTTHLYPQISSTRPKIVFFEAPTRVLEFDADHENIERILGNYDEISRVIMNNKKQNRNELLGVEAEPLTPISAKEIDRSLNEFSGKSLVRKNLYPDKQDAVKTDNSSVMQCNDKSSNIPTSLSTFAGVKSAKSVPVSHSGTTASVLVKIASDDNNCCKQNQKLSQLTSNNHTTVIPESVNMFKTEPTPQIKKQTAKITFQEPVPQHIIGKFEFSKSLFNKAVSSSVDSFDNKDLKHMLPEKKRNGNGAAVNSVRFKHKPKQQMLEVSEPAVPGIKDPIRTLEKSHEIISSSSNESSSTDSASIGSHSCSDSEKDMPSMSQELVKFSPEDVNTLQSQQNCGQNLLETSAMVLFVQSVHHSYVKRGDDLMSSDDLMSDENPLSSGQEGQSGPMSEDELFPPVPEKNSGTLQCELDLALLNKVNFADNRQDIPMEDSPEHMIAVVPIGKPVSPISNAPIDKTLKTREHVQSLAHEACALPSFGTPITVTGSIPTKVKPFNIGINLISAILCLVKHSPDFLKSSIVSKTVNDGLTQVDSVVNQCVSEQPMENSSRNKINANLVKEQDALKLESVPNSHKEQDALKSESVPNSHKEQDALKLESVLNSQKEMSDSLSHSDIGSKKHKLSIKQYVDAVKRRKTSLESQPRIPCTDMAKLLLNPDDLYKQAKNYKHQADSMEASLKKYVLYLEAALCYLQCGYAMEKSKEQRINKAVSMYIDTNKFVAHQYQHLVAFQGQDTKEGNMKLKLIVLCLWIQSFVYLKLHMLKKNETITLEHLLHEQGGDQMLLKVISAGRDGQGIFKVPQGVVRFPQKLHSISQKYLKQGHDLWTQANSAITTDMKELFQKIDKSNGPLTLDSGLDNMINYVKAAITNLSV